jgi:hypothetical protein
MLEHSQLILWGLLVRLAGAGAVAESLGCGRLARVFFVFAPKARISRPEAIFANLTRAARGSNLQQKNAAILCAPFGTGADSFQVVPAQAMDYPANPPMLRLNR